MSISPRSGHGVWNIQNAGHVPQPVGTCLRSAMMSEPALYVSSVLIRAELRFEPSASADVLSTETIAVPVEEIDVRLSAFASASAR